MLYASYALKGDKDFMLKAVKTNGYALKSVLTYNNDKEIVLEALK